MRKIISVFLMIWGGLQAQTQQIWQMEGDSVFTYYLLEEVVFYGERLTASPSMITELPAREIRKSSGTTVAGVLKNDPGIVINTGAKAETETRIRGFDARDVLVLVDGRPINPGYYGKADLSMLPKDNIAKIRVIKGPASVAYGANAMGGVVNIVTKNGFEEPQTRLDAEFGGNAFRRIGLNHSGRSGRFNYWLSGYEHHTDGFEMSEEFQTTSMEDGGLRENSMYRKVGANLKLGYQPSDRSMYQFSAGYHWAEKECPWTIYSWDNPQYRVFPEWERYSLSVSGQWRLSPLAELKSVLFADAYHDRFVDYQTRGMDTNLINYDSLLENWTVGGSADLVFKPHPKHKIHGGVHFRRDLMNKKPDTDEDWFSHHHITATIFGEEVFRPWNTTVLTAGFSAGWFRSVNRDEPEINWSPMIGLSQKLPLRLGMSVSYANAVRYPTMHQLYSNASGNENLKPEAADKFEIGLYRMFALLPARDWHCNIEIAWFYNILTDLIYRESRSYQYRNIVEARLQGWEARVRFDLLPILSAVVSYAYFNNSQSTRELMEEVPKNQIGIRLSAQTGFGLELNYEFNFVDDRITHTDTYILESYPLHHISVSQKIRTGFRLHIRIRNVLNADYQEELGYPAPGRQVTAGFSWALK